MLTPAVPTGNPVQVYFVELILKQNGNFVDRNVYWLSTQPDVVNWTKTLGQPQGTETTFANLTSLQTLPQPSVSATATTAHQQDLTAGPDHDGHDHEHVKLDGRLPAPRRRPARDRGRPGTVRRQRAAVVDLAEQRHHAFPWRVADPDGDVELGRSAGYHGGGQRLGLEPRQIRHRSDNKSLEFRPANWPRGPKE